ncbi:hypothetical protein EsH8_IX_000933 [Colletotrichum jinshuiense]
MVVGEGGNANTRPTASERAAARRRLVRKGTKSCWECRRRKIRCIFDESGPRDTCRTCWQKGAPCISQEFLEEDAKNTQVPAGSLGDRLGRVERLMEQLAQRVDGLDNPISDCPEQKPQESRTSIPRPPITACSPALSVHTDDEFVKTDHQAARGLSFESNQGTSKTTLQSLPNLAHEPQAFLDRDCSARFSTNAQLVALTRRLTAAIPSEEECQAIYKLYSDADLIFQLIFTPHCFLESLKPQSVEQFMNSLREPMHPVLLAKKMLMLCTMLQRVPSTHVGDPAALKPSSQIMERLAETAISVVCDNITLMGTIEALECLVLQTVYLANGGNPRLALLACRRAVSVAQLMGIHRPHDPASIETISPDAPAETGFVWFRILCLERFTCLLLGLPSSTQESATVPQETTQSYIDSHPLGRLEWVHCKIAAKIIQRNEQASGVSNMDTTHALDLELQVAAATMPPRWWSVPDFSKRHDGHMGLVWRSLQLCNQLFHFFLIIEVHLPFMLRHSKDGAANSSRMACVDASREVLARFIHIRSARGVCSFPDAADFFALIAAMTLMLAHIDARRRDRGNDVLAHQRHTDRDKVEETLEFMREGSSKSTDMLSMKSADVLRSLLDIEADAARGSTFTASLSSKSTPAYCGIEEERAEGSRNILQLKIPCYGTVTISPDAPPSRQPWMPPDRAHQWAPPANPTLGSISTAAPTDAGYLTTAVLDDEPVTRKDKTAGSTNHDQGLQVDPYADGKWLLDYGNPPLFGPVIATGVEDWPFQGVDAAFFDSMIRGFEGSDPSN